MKFENNSLPEKLTNYLDEIYNNEELKDAFDDCDIEFNDEEWLDDIINNEDEWKEDFEGGEYNYDAKPFASSADGGLWVILNNQLVGYIGTEGECGIVARNIDEFMNIVAVCKGCIFDIDILESEESFIDELNERNEENDYTDVFEDFMNKHRFEKNPKEVYKMVKLGLTVKPFFIIKATDDEYEDSYSLLGSDDGQETLEEFIRDCL